MQRNPDQGNSGGPTVRTTCARTCKDQGSRGIQRKSRSVSRSTSTLGSESYSNEVGCDPTRGGDEKERESEKGGAGKSKGRGTSNERHHTHPEQRVVHTNDTIGIIDVELPIAYGRFLHAILSSFARGGIVLVSVPVIGDGSLLGREGTIRNHTYSTLITSADFGAVDHCADVPSLAT